jgi:hypothetical protein
MVSIDLGDECRANKGPNGIVWAANRRRQDKLDGMLIFVFDFV